MDFYNEIAQKSGLNVKVRLESNFPDNPINFGYYHLHKNEVVIATETVEQYFQMFRRKIKGLTKRELMQICIGHELGHASDTSLKQSIKKIYTLENQIRLMIKNKDMHHCKRFYKEKVRHILNQEYFAWISASRYFIDDIEQKKVNIIQKLFLTTYYKTFKDEYKLMLLENKVILRVLNYQAFFPSDMDVYITYGDLEESEYNKEENVYYINIDHIEKNRPITLKNKISPVNYILYQSLYEFSKAKSKRLIDKNEEEYARAFDYASKGKELSNVMQLFESYANKVLDLEGKILNELEDLFQENAKFIVFKEMAMSRTKEKLNDSKNTCLHIYNDYKQKNDKIAN